MSNTNFKSEFITESVRDHRLFVNEYLGDGAAEIEWEKSKEETIKRFINIESYESFISKKNLFLIGRIGTGKTSLLKMFDFEIKKNNLESYLNSIIIDGEEHYHELSSVIRMSPYNDLIYGELEHHLSEKWKWIIYVNAMITTIEKVDSSPDLYKNKSLTKVRQYLEDKNLKNAKRSFRYMLKSINKELASVDHLMAGVSVAITNIILNLTSNDFDDAVIELEDFLNEYGRVVVMMDTIKLYNTEDKVSYAVMTSLISACKSIYRNSNNIIAKVAIPSEIFCELSAVHIEKTNGHTVYIDWRYKDLVNLVGRRIELHYTGNVTDLDNKEYLNDLIGEYCRTTTSIDFQSIGYVIRHTQKKPRQVINIFNTWLNMKEKSPNMDKDELLRRAVHHNPSVNVEGALTIYTNVSHRILDIVKTTFSDCKYCISYSELDRRLKLTSGIRDNIQNSTLKKVFLSSGILGVASEKHVINEGDNRFNNDRPIRVKEALFEYQIKGTLPFNADTYFVLHPMSYQYFRISFDRNTFVYPRPAEDEEDFDINSYHEGEV